MESALKKKHTHGRKSTVFALVGNMTITILKAIGFFLSGSGVLFSETIHSIADTINQSFLLIGISRSSKTANKTFSYGYGKERFFRALISACGVFFIGAGVTVYHGIEGLFTHHQIVTSWITFSILGVSLVVESITLWIALKELFRGQKGRKIKQIFREGDPVTLAVIYEDGIAVLGVIIAFISIGLSRITGNIIRDSIGSISIGIMLGVLALILIDKNRGFLIGKTIPLAIQEEIIEMLEQEPIIEKVILFKSNILDIDTYHINCEVECNGTGLLKTIGRKNFLKKEYETATENYQNFLEFCIDYTRRVPRVIGKHIDDVEKRIKERFPQIKHIDIEIN